MERKLHWMDYKRYLPDKWQSERWRRVFAHEESSELTACDVWESAAYSVNSKTVWYFQLEGPGQGQTYSNKGSLGNCAVLYKSCFLDTPEGGKGENLLSQRETRKKASETFRTKKSSQKLGLIRASTLCPPAWVKYRSPGLSPGAFTNSPDPVSVGTPPAPPIWPNCQCLSSGGHSGWPDDTNHPVLSLQVPVMRWLPWQLLEPQVFMTLISGSHFRVWDTEMNIIQTIV